MGLVFRASLTSILNLKKNRSRTSKRPTLGIRALTGFGYGYALAMKKSPLEEISPPGCTAWRWALLPWRAACGSRGKTASQSNGTRILSDGRGAVLTDVEDIRVVAFH